MRYARYRYQSSSVVNPHSRLSVATPADSCNSLACGFHATMEFFTSFRSKKTSEAGVWIQDDDVENCGCCGIKFALLIRKHHCRVGSPRTEAVQPA